MNMQSPSSEERPSVIAGDKLGGRVALVTGGTRGIGAAICRSLASPGAPGYIGPMSEKTSYASFAPAAPFLGRGLQLRVAVLHELDVRVGRVWRSGAERCELHRLELRRHQRKLLVGGVVLENLRIAVAHLAVRDACGAL